MSMGAMYWADVYAGTKFENKTNAYWALRELKHSAQWLHDAVMTRPGQALVSVGDLTTFEFYGRPQDAPVVRCYSIPSALLSLELGSAVSTGAAL